jgi:hypothetical protein
MGSTGSGSFSDYSNSKPLVPGDDTGGSDGIDKCDRAFSTKLEEVAICDYFIQNKIVPPKGTKVEIYFSKRLVARTFDGDIIGYLPTKYNYLKLCIEGGYKYKGEVASSTGSPIQKVVIDIIPTNG